METRHEKREIYRNGKLHRVSWIAKGIGVAVELWVMIRHDEPTPDDFMWGPVMMYHDCHAYPGGVEVHSAAPLYEEADYLKPISNCSVLGGECFTDGSSLAASNYFEPYNRRRISVEPGFDERAFRMLDERLADYQVKEAPNAEA